MAPSLCPEVVVVFPDKKTDLLLKLITNTKGRDHQCDAFVPCKGLFRERLHDKLVLHGHLLGDLVLHRCPAAV